MGFTHYIFVDLNKNKKLYKTHRLVAKHFIPDFEDSFSIKHIDGNKTNNRVDNLQMIKQIDRKLVNSSQRIICINTGEIIKQFKRFCREHNIAYSRYFLIRHLRGIDEYYHKTFYKFKSVNKEY